MTVKNFRISVGLDTNSAGVPGVTWALVYAPYGSSINSLTTSTGSLYEPSSHVINSGVWDFDAGPLRIYTSMARILHPGDYVYLLMRSTGAAVNVVSNYQAVVTYASKWN